MRVAIVGFNLPGSTFCRPDGSPMVNVHVGVQHRRDPAELVRADSIEARWYAEVEVIERDGGFDFKGPVVQGKLGERFIYLTWGEVHPGARFEQFRRAKLMLNRIEPETLGAARRSGHLVARVDLTGPDGGPRCARVDPPAIAWSVPAS